MQQPTTTLNNDLHVSEKSGAYSVFHFRFRIKYSEERNHVKTRGQLPGR